MKSNELRKKMAREQLDDMMWMFNAMAHWRIAAVILFTLLASLVAIGLLCGKASAFEYCGWRYDVVESCEYELETNEYCGSYNKYNDYSGSDWCGSFVNWIMIENGLNDDLVWPKEGVRQAAIFQGIGGWLTESGVESFTADEVKQFGGDLYSARPGDIIIFCTSSLYGLHAAFITDTGEDYITIIEGESTKGCLQSRTFCTLDEVTYKGNAIIYALTYEEETI